MQSTRNEAGLLCQAIQLAARSNAGPVHALLTAVRTLNGSPNVSVLEHMLRDDAARAALVTTVLPVAWERFIKILWAKRRAPYSERCLKLHVEFPELLALLSKDSQLQLAASYARGDALASLMADKLPLNHPVGLMQRIRRLCDRNGQILAIQMLRTALERQRDRRRFFAVELYRAATRVYGTLALPTLLRQELVNHLQQNGYLLGTVRRCIVDGKITHGVAHQRVLYVQNKYKGASAAYGGETMIFDARRNKPLSMAGQVIFRVDMFPAYGRYPIFRPRPNNQGKTR